MPTKKLIINLLEGKRLYTEYIEYERGCPIPSGYCEGWTIILDDYSKNLVHTFERNLISTTYSWHLMARDLITLLNELNHFLI